MKYANVSVKFPSDLDEGIEEFIEETGVYTNKSEFIKEACRSHLEELSQDPAILALRLEKLLSKAEKSSIKDTEVNKRLEELSNKVNSESVEEAIEEAREDTAEKIH